MGNLLQLIDGRSGERLVQALILHAASEEGFRDEFVEWLGFEEEGTCTRIREEVKDKGLRYDLVLEFPHGKEKHVELKLHAGFTEEQHRELTSSETSSFHAVIVPEYRLEDVKKQYGKAGAVFKTWEDFAKGPARATPRSVVLFDRMMEYIHGVEVISVGQVKNGLHLWSERKWSWENDWGLFHRFLVRLRYETKRRYPDLQVGPVKSAPKSNFYGFNIGRKKMTGYVWFGLVSVPAEDWLGFYIQSHGQAEDVLKLGEAEPDDRYWKFYETKQKAYVEKMSCDSQSRYTLKSIMRTLWGHLDKLDPTHEVAK